MEELEVKEQHHIAIVHAKISPKADAKSRFKVKFLDGSPKVADLWYTI